ncbi:hypothetical protein [Desulfobulbus sp.]|uniref:hypothetical protein n=1 Tax=Desulfobulbus sp. TaxID=895 RepID=UPI0027BAD9ED|nr:hypothetical protein [Desulfobulbus sp.]
MDSTPYFTSVIFSGVAMQAVTLVRHGVFLGKSTENRALWLTLRVWRVCEVVKCLGRQGLQAARALMWKPVKQSAQSFWRPSSDCSFSRRIIPILLQQLRASVISTRTARSQSKTGRWSVQGCVPTLEHGNDHAPSQNATSPTLSRYRQKRIVKQIKISKMENLIQECN